MDVENLRKAFIEYKKNNPGAVKKAEENIGISRQSLYSFSTGSIPSPENQKKIKIFLQREGVIGSSRTIPAVRENTIQVLDIDDLFQYMAYIQRNERDHKKQKLWISKIVDLGNELETLLTNFENFNQKHEKLKEELSHDYEQPI